MHWLTNVSLSLCISVCLSPTQALLRGALSQQSAVILVCMAVDRYMCALHPRRYYQHSSKKVSGTAGKSVEGRWRGRGRS